jgi:hypothetical protein
MVSYQLGENGSGIKLTCHFSGIFLGWFRNKLTVSVQAGDRDFTWSGKIELCCIMIKKERTCMVRSGL